MELKEYQKQTLATVLDYTRHLAALRDKAEQVRKIDPDLDFDFAVKAWEKAGTGRSCIPRRNGLGEPLPCYCLKLPTGGGKTLLATRVVDIVNTHYFRRQTGLVLWVVPTTQIYNQTLQALKDRDHPYRQFLDISSGGRTVILERQSGFSPADVEENLCILMLMLPAANRQTKEQLRMFRDSGGFERFFPSEEEIQKHAALLEAIPNLDTFEKESGFWGRQIKTSLGNTLRLLQPLIILDEGQKAYSEGARNTLEGFNPSMMVELSATPPKQANVLVRVAGTELNREEMIKLDLHIQNRSSADWKDTLLASIEHRDRLEKKAREHEARTGIYIRPICLIQVERTGKDQRKPGFIHADDVADYLIQTRGLPAEQVAIKSSQKDELKEVDEADGLLDRNCAIRYIITKQALQEGWDCPFAYVLTLLTNPASKNALTQLVGRILRQPYARKTGVAELDESYVFCFQRRGRELLKEVRKGFGLEGLGDLESLINVEDSLTPRMGRMVAEEARSEYKTAIRKLVLPAFFIKDQKEWRLVHYEADILSRIPWAEVKIDPLFKLKLLPNRDKDIELRAGLDERLHEFVETTGELPPSGVDQHDPDYAFVAGHLLDVMPNPWHGYEFAQKTFTKLLEQHSHELVMDNFVFIVEELRKQLESERDRLAEQVFENLLKTGEMRFMVIADHIDAQRLPAKEAHQEGQKRATRLDGNQFELSLFEHVPESDLNDLEQQVATYLDEQDRLFFWYRNASRKDYAIQGWKRNRIFADFIFTLSHPDTKSKDPFRSVFVLETKGLHLSGNQDTTYKRNVLDVCNQKASLTEWSEFAPFMKDKHMRFEVVDQDEWQRRLNDLLSE